MNSLPANAVETERLHASPGDRSRRGRSGGGARGRAQGPRGGGGRGGLRHRHRHFLAQQRSHPWRHVLRHRHAARAPLRARAAHAVRILRLARRAAPQMRQAGRRHQCGRARQDPGDRKARPHQWRRRPGNARRQCGARAWSRNFSASARCIRRKPASSTATPTCWRCAAISRTPAAPSRSIRR